MTRELKRRIRLGALRVDVPWLAVSGVVLLVIWCNSLVGGSGSSGMSSGVLGIIQGALSALGLPFAWLTEFLIRKAAHFTEYAVLGFCVSRALCVGRGAPWLALAVAAGVLVGAPCIDEFIQTFVPGRCGQFPDVILDCCGASFGALTSYLLLKRHS